MAIKSLEYLKSRYQTGSLPTQQDFEDMLDTTYTYLGLVDPPQITRNATADGVGTVLFDAQYGDITSQFNIGDVITSIDGPAPGSEAFIISIQTFLTNTRVNTTGLLGGYTSVMSPDVSSGTILVKSRLGIGLTGDTFPQERMDISGTINVRSPYGATYPTALKIDGTDIIGSAFGMTIIGNTQGVTSFGTPAGGLIADNTDPLNPEIKISTSFGDPNIKVENTGRVTIKDILNITPRASAPLTGSTGDVYVNSGDNHIYCYLNSSWRQLDN